MTDILALPPFELREEEYKLDKKQLCEKLANLVLMLMLSEGELQRLEIRWNKGEASIRTLMKADEPEKAESDSEVGQSGSEIGVSAPPGVDAPDSSADLLR